MSIPGNRIFKKINRPSQELIASFKNLPTSNIADNMSRMFCSQAAISPVRPEMKAAGPAFTVKVRPGDNLFLHKAMDMAEPGDVLVVDGQGETTNSLLGEIMVRYALKRGLGGIVADGAIRDYDGICALGRLPVFARGYSPMGPYKDGPGEINTPINCGGAIVKPGDIVVGDADGVVYVPLADAEKILKATQAKSASEAEIFNDIENGRYDRTWVDAQLTRIGTEVIDDYCKF